MPILSPKMLSQDDTSPPAGLTPSPGGGIKRQLPQSTTDDKSASGSTPPSHSLPRQAAISRSGPSEDNPNPTRQAPTPIRRRSGAPTSIPNFPSSHTHRTPAPDTGFPSSPIRSPGQSSPTLSPPTSAASTPFKLPIIQPRATPGGSVASPWAYLGATSGAPTPSLDGPGRSSPHLGGPFEQLNLNGSWSGGNLWAEGSPDPAPVVPARAASVGSGSGMNSEMLAKYRNMAGRASASGSGGVGSGGVGAGSSAMEGVESSQQPMIKPSLPAALARRRASLPKAGLGLTPTPASSHGVKSPSPLGSTSTSTESTPQALAASDVPRYLSQPSTLILDVRPPSAFVSSHLPSSHSIPIPSTLIRRPAFTIGKVLLMLSPESRDAVQAWKGTANIILLDADSTSAASGTLLEGLASKFVREGYAGKIWFVRGGQTALESTPGVRMEDSESVPDTQMGSPGPGMPSPSGNFNAGGLGSFAFLHGKSLVMPTIDGDTHNRAPLSHIGSTGSGLPAPQPNSGGGFSFTPTANHRSNPFESMSMTTSTDPSSDKNRPLSLKGMMLGGAQSSTSGLSGTSGSSSKPKLQPANPFFDNIRQNLELSHGGITERIPLNLPSEVKERAQELPTWLANLVEMDEDKGADELAKQFYTVERNEQKRLQALMDWHTEASGAVLPGTTSDDLGSKGKASSWAKQQKKDKADVERLAEWGKGRGISGLDGEEYYPFSITAGVERGIKNRYKNIWPYDFSRVRLITPCEDESDYINASYIQPRGTSRRYIATQGPLDATYQDFWTLIWEQDVRVIVMLTKQFEGGLVKCGNYWQETNYGPLHLKLDSQAGGEDHGRPANSGFDFGVPDAPAPNHSTSDSSSNIRRTFILSNDNHPDDPPRHIVQLQCVSWPDFDVPTSPDVLLGLINDVGVARTETINPGEGGEEDQPVLIHCSAGIGRTGSFILVDAILDALEKSRAGGRKIEEERHASVPREVNSMPIPGRHNSAGQSRHGSGSPRAAGGDMEKGHSGRVKSVSFASGDKVALAAKATGAAVGAGEGGGDGEKRVKKTISSSILSGSGGSIPHKSISAPIKLSSQPPSQPFDWLPPSDIGMAAQQPNSGEEGGGGEGMEIDSPFEYPPSSATSNNLVDNSSRGQVDQWLQYRGDRDGGASESGTTHVSDGGRRPSIASAYNSDEKLSSERLSTVSEDPVPMVFGNRTEREPTPLAEMENPVLDVLESMRVQRMSLVQSLRQFVFAYKVIIHKSFLMAEEDKMRAELQAEEDDLTSKRRASPTELAHDRPLLEIDPREDIEKGDKSALGRKASVKRMKQES